MSYNVFIAETSIAESASPNCPIPVRYTATEWIAVAHLGKEH